MTFNKKWIIIAAVVLILLLSTKKVKAFDIIKVFEGERLQAYPDSGGVWTIGYGTTVNPDTNKPIKQGDTIDKETAERWLKQDIEKRQYALSKLIKVPVNANQLAALTSLAYNIGLGAFQTSTLLRLLNQNKPKIEVAEQFLKWNKIKGTVSKGLTNRRKLEKDLFLK
jgi:lysozyme